MLTWKTIRWAAATLALGGTLGCISVEHVSQPATPVRPSAGDAGRVETRVDVKPRPEFNTHTYAIELSYENTSPRTYTSLNFRCRFRDSQGYQVGTLGITAPIQAGPYAPGFKGRFWGTEDRTPGNLAVQCEIVDAVLDNTHP